MKTSHPWVYVCEVSVLQGLREDCKNFQRKKSRLSKYEEVSNSHQRFISLNTGCCKYCRQNPKANTLLTPNSVPDKLPFSCNSRIKTSSDVQGLEKLASQVPLLRNNLAFRK